MELVAASFGSFSCLGNAREREKAPANLRSKVNVISLPSRALGQSKLRCAIPNAKPPKASVQSTDVETVEERGAAGDSSLIGTSSWERQTRIYEYTSAADPVLKSIPRGALHASDHRFGESRVTSLDLSREMEIEGYPASSPNLLASFVRVCVGESLTTTATATSQAFYVIHGQGRTRSEFGEVEWKTGDLFVLPGSREETSCTHFCDNDDKEGTGGAGLYWVHDSPLLSYLGVVPKSKKFEPTFFSWELLMANMEVVRQEEGAEHRNRLGILLGNAATPQTKTLSHTLWSLLNVLPAGRMQKPHRHSSVALDLAVYAAPGTYTLMGEQLDGNGNIINPVRMEWQTGAMFVTPPRWWHSHHNDSNEEAWVLPMQDAGLYTHQRTLDIRFSDVEIQLMKKNVLK